MRALIVTSRNLNSSFCGEFYKVKSFVYALRSLGYEVEIFNTSFKKYSEPSIWDCKVHAQNPSIFMSIIRFIFNFPTSIQRSIFSPVFNDEFFSGYDLVVFSLVRTVPYNRKFSTNVLVDFADLLSVNFKRLSTQQNFPYKQIRVLESWLLTYDENTIGKNYISLFVSKQETILASKRNIKAYNLMQPAPISLNNIDRPMDNYIHCKPNRKFKRQILFLGPNNYLPNHEALLWLEKYLYPSLSKEWSIVWIGKNSRKYFYEGIIEKGFIDNLEEEIVCSAINIVPIFTSTGVQNKLIDCLYLGANVLTLKSIARSADAIHDPNIHIATSKKELVTKTISLINNYEMSSDFIINKVQLNPKYGLFNFTDKLKGAINASLNY